MTSTRAAVLSDRYELAEIIGTGGMAEVWRARDTRLQRDVAVKIVPVGAHDPSRVRRIVREAKAMASLSHPNVLAVYDYGEDEDGRPYIVTEFVDGPDLHRVLNEEGTLDPGRVREIMRGVLFGVEVAHHAGIVHGDLKPANVLMAAQGPKVGDFGVARVLEEETGNTTIAATPKFAAPEILKGLRATPASDIYSAACLAFQLLTGRAPYDGANGWEVAAKHIESPVPHVSEFVDVPPEIDAAIHRGMAKDPQRRFRSAAEFARAFDAPATTVPASTTPVAAPEATERIGPAPDLAKVALFGPLWPWLKRTRDRARGLIERPSLAGLAILCAFLIVIGLLAFHTSGPAVSTMPNVVGKNVTDAVATLQKAGLRPDVSYRPITTGRAGIVAETVPPQGAKLPRGSAVHVIATAFAATPTPAPVVRQQTATTPVRQAPAREPAHKKHGRKG
jgi:predicted Ser/Thr protein kinase